MGLVQAGHATHADDPGLEPLLPDALRGDGDGEQTDGPALLTEPTPLRNPVAEDAGGVVGADRDGAQPLQVPRDALGRLVLGLLQTMLPGRLEDLESPRVATLFLQLRQRVSLALGCTVLTAPIAVWLLVRGVATYIASEGPACGGPLRIWLLGFLMLQLAWPICMPSLTLLLLGWCLGALVLLHEPKHCARIHEFLFEACALQTTQAVLLLVAAIAALTARPLVQQLGELLSYSGTDPEVIRQIIVRPWRDVPFDEECVICLTRDDEDGVPWRQLACRHSFHEPCLLKWLGKARRCPVCRMDLHFAYRQSAGADFDAVA
mmetsp:Transcript_70013/g.177706  ORF Transcript_70013/g.177706 Transcript_70013/m.177706 type:complete len:320 (-) Transcript_70013:152-1111(-)